jgi:hypothetical protein
MRKAFGGSAGLTKLGISLGVIGVLLVVIDIGLVQVTIPAMVVLGPLMVLQYTWWARRAGMERTMWQYLRSDARHAEHIS